MVTVILQADVLEEVINSDAQEKYVGKYEFDKSLEGMLLQPISFISRSTLFPLENSRHVFFGEATTVRWAIVTFINYLWGSPFMVLSYFSGMKKFFES